MDKMDIGKEIVQSIQLWVSQAKGIALSSGNALFIETCLVVDPTDSQTIDSGTTNHICNLLQVQEIKSLSDGEISIKLGTRITVTTRVVE